ncbi:MAG TPA: serine/threonine-protein kinase, partial [Gemmataceae bacterium]|nr:serine/threonine-protein kinase [Gemmataceae bacterium]
MTTEPIPVQPTPAAPPPPPAAAGTICFPPDTATDGPSPPHEPGRVRVGEPLGKYTITGMLGQGGMGMVLKAHDAAIERDVAIKVLADYLAGDSTSLGRFVAEAKAAGRVNHPNVVAIYEIGQEGPTHYLALEYVPGGSLADRMAGGAPLSPLQATQALIDACKGVGAAHAAGLIHRDIKPANFMLTADGTVKVADFGLAKTAGDAGRHLTQTGTAVGTPFFMSPEQCEAKAVDHRTDLYSLGATYYSLLTGKYPFHRSATVPQLMYQHCHGPIPDPRTDNPTVPEACAKIVARAMAKAPADRYQSTAEMLADLQAVAATLSGQTQITLPSESGIVPAARFAGAMPTALPGHGSGSMPTQNRGYATRVTVAGIGFLVLIGVVFAIWRPWHTRNLQEVADLVERLQGKKAAGAMAAAEGEPVKVGVLQSL